MSGKHGDRDSGGDSDEAAGSELPRFDRQSLDRRFEELRLEFEAGQSPSTFWAAVRLAFLIREHLPMPEWVWKELDAIAGRLHSARWSSYDDQMNLDPGAAEDWQRKVLTAFGFHWSEAGGASNPFKADDRRIGFVHLAERVRLLIDGEGLNQTNAVMLVAQQQGASEATVLRAWKAFAAATRVASVEDLKHRVEHDDRKIAESLSLDPTNEPGPPLQ